MFNSSLKYKNDRAYKSLNSDPHFQLHSSLLHVDRWKTETDTKLKYIKHMIEKFPMIWWVLHI